jgi:tetratricopeptide (TPR) repeat protein
MTSEAERRQFRDAPRAWHSTHPHRQPPARDAGAWSPVGRRGRKGWLPVLALAVPLAVVAGTSAGAGPETAEEALTILRGSSDPTARSRAVRILADRGGMEHLPPLVRALRDPDPDVRSLAEDALWRIWSRSGDPAVDRLFAEGVDQLRERQLEQAVDTFSRIIARKPDFAEGWNKRATVYYWLGDYEKSLADCDEVMKRNPHHFGALSGYGLIYMQLDRPERAIEYFERALAINPNLDQVAETIEALRRSLRARGRETT